MVDVGQMMMTSRTVLDTVTVVGRMLQCLLGSTTTQTDAWDGLGQNQLREPIKHLPVYVESAGSSQVKSSQVKSWGYRYALA